MSIELDLRHLVLIPSVILAALIPGELGGQAGPVQERNVRSLMLSDLHVNVFYDPQKVYALMSAPAGRWAEILAGSDSPSRARDAERLHAECQAGGSDPSPALFAATMQSVAKNAGDVRFVTISGDFLPHKIDCVLAKLVPGISPQQYASFTARIVEYEVSRVRVALPGARLYLALGNNDSNCRDNYLDSGTEWLKTLAGVARDGAGDLWNERATASFEEGGYYSVEMAPPMERTRLIAANDLLLSGGFRSCSGRFNPEAAEREMTWLRSELKEARDRHERVWLLAHIPVGMSTILRPKMAQMCKADVVLRAGEEMLTEALQEYADATKLAIFGHSHQDQLQLLDARAGMIPVKVVRAVPSFTVARVDPESAEMGDYAVMRPEDPANGRWIREYSFSDEYGVDGYTAGNLKGLMARFGADPDALTPASEHYLLHFAGGKPEQLRRAREAWPITACQMSHIDPEGYKECVCGSRLGPSLGAPLH